MHKAPDFWGVWVINFSHYKVDNLGCKFNVTYFACS